MSVDDLGSTGAAVMSVFHGLSFGKGRRPFSVPPPRVDVGDDGLSGLFGEAGAVGLDIDAGDSLDEEQAEQTARTSPAVSVVSAVRRMPKARTTRHRKR